MSDNDFNKVLVTGGAGYVGSVLVPKLLAAGHRVRVLDLFMFGEDILSPDGDNPNLEQIKGDIRNRETLENALEGCDAVIHLACISNDPSFELDPELGKSINYDAFVLLTELARDMGVRRFIYASSSSVYGIKDVDNVTEELPLLPLTDYSKYKALCEDVLEEEREPGFVTLILRPSTVCGYGPRLRLDLTVNILTNHAVNNGRITVFGGDQKRPNIHIQDMADLYLHCLDCADETIDGKIYNAGWENFTVGEIAKMVRDVVGEEVTIETTPSDDNRSYHVSSEKMRRELGFVPSHTIADAVRDLVDAFEDGRVPEAMEADRYSNIKTMQRLRLK